MAISDELKRIYTQNLPNRVYDAIVFSHPLFVGMEYANGDSFYIVNDHKERTFDINGKLITFRSAQFSVVLPNPNDAQQDMNVITPLLGVDMMKKMDEITNHQQRIKVDFYMFLGEHMPPEAHFGTLEVKQVGVDTSNYTTNLLCSRIDLYNTYFLNELYDKRFAGLYL